MNTQKINHLTIPTEEGYLLLPQEKILYCQSDGNHTIIFQDDDTKVICCRKLKAVEKGMTTNFFIRVHQSYLVNLNFLQKFLRKNGGTLQLINETHIPVSRSRKGELLARLKPI